MDVLGKFLSCKVQSIVSSLYMLWMAKIPIPLKNPKKLPAQLGLKSLIHPEPKQTPYQPHGASIVHRHSTSSLTQVSKQSSPLLSSPLLSSSMFRSPVMGDMIGAESGDNMSSNIEELKGSRQMDTSEYQAYNKPPTVRHRNAMTNKYPPPISLLMGNFPGRMPWVFKRESSDGRLVIKAEKLKGHEYLQAHRENGRLIMRLVPADDTLYCDEYAEPITGDEGKDKDLEELKETEQATVREEHSDEEYVALPSEVAASSLEDESEHEPCASLRKCFACAGEMGQDSVSLCNKGNGIGLHNGFLGRPGSAPIRPMAAVM